ncbi:alpha/beta fold hydrolase [Leucobacter sp.]
MHVSTLGDERGRPVLLLHGGGVAGWMWNPLIEHLGDELRLLVPDLPGHDRSADEGYRSHDRTASELAALLAGTGSAPAAVVGFSLGAQLAVLLAARHPELVERVAVISAQAAPTPAPRLTLALLGATAGLARRDWFARLQAKELFIPPGLLEDYLRTSAGISRSTLLAAVGENIRFTVPAGWSGFPGSALILAGSRERRLMRASAETLHRALPGSAREIVDGAGHGIPLQRPEWLAQRLRRWSGEQGSHGASSRA